MQKIYPSSYAVSSGNTITGYANKCLRYLKFKGKSPRSEIDPVYKAIGALAEERVMAKYPELKKAEREISVKTEIGGVLISGRADYVTKDHVWEIKATLSGNKRAQMRKQIDPVYLGQLVYYMVALGKPGRLHFSYVHFNRSFDLSFEDQTFDVEIRDAKLFVNDEEYGYVVEVLRYYGVAAKALTSSELPEPPINKPCDNCPFSKTCSQNPKSIEEFLDKLIVSEVQGPIPNIKVHNRR